MLALLTDLYQLTMACGYRRAGLADREACFHLTFRRNPFGGGFAVACGLARAVAHLESFRFGDGELGYLRGLTGANGEPLLDEAFLARLRGMRFSCDVDAVPEGTVVFPHQPLVRVRGPLDQCQILETPLLTLVNFETLIATKAARVCAAARGDPVIEFGLRRAQGADGGLSASRAAYVGGCVATSNVLAGARFQIPVRGTHAHSWVMCFDDEVAAFDAYADAMPHNCVLLVDTYDTLEGVRRAARIGARLRDRGQRLLGVRLDSGDLLELSVAARKILDEAGLADAAIVASNDLDEYAIADLKARGAAIGVWGVGTRLATAYDQPALGGVYKLSALRDADGTWRPKVKLSEDPIKVSTPGVLQTRRAPGFGGDTVHDLDLGWDGEGEDLLVPVFRAGERVADPPAAVAARARALAQLAALPAGVRRMHEPETYPVRLEPRLEALKARLVGEAAR